jgi:hypothetical protein
MCRLKHRVFNRISVGKLSCVAGHCGLFQIYYLLSCLRQTVIERRVPSADLSDRPAFSFLVEREGGGKLKTKDKWIVKIS